METLTEHASAKVNLALCVTGQRSDGFHLLETFVAFAEFGDEISASASSSNQLTITGRFGSMLSQESLSPNLIIKARDALFEQANAPDLPPVHLTCEKNLPLASGLGGGSADAAATLRLLRRFWSLDISDEALSEIAETLGADVPMCVKSQPLIATGIGEKIELMQDMPSSHIVLANPLVAVSTPDVFNKLESKQNSSLKCPLAFNNTAHFEEIVCEMRNDLQAPAMLVAPQIGSCLKVLEETGPIFWRMSGSGATCFALYKSQADAHDAQETITNAHPDWFVKATLLKGV